VASHDVDPPQSHRGGLYDPAFEHDACGVGFVVDIAGRRSHDVIARGLEVLINLQHRGACGCESNTGDGAGILIQIPDRFFRRVLAGDGIVLPAPGQYGGAIFLPTDHSARACVRRSSA
jgi:glutamate synthase (ferredoxin)